MGYPEIHRAGRAETRISVDPFSAGSVRASKSADSARSHWSLHEIVQIAGGRSEVAAGEYIQKLKSDKRYQRDVY
jgi:hypothetical protein